MSSSSRRTVIPADDSAFCTEAVRAYCMRKGYPLPEVWVGDFRRVFEENRRRHYDWEATFKNFIRNNSPSGRFYRPYWWEEKLIESKQLEARRYAPQPKLVPSIGEEPRASAGIPQSAHEVLERFMKRRVGSKA